MEREHGGLTEIMKRWLVWIWVEDLFVPALMTPGLSADLGVSNFFLLASSGIFDGVQDSLDLAICAYPPPCTVHCSCWDMRYDINTYIRSAQHPA